MKWFVGLALIFWFGSGLLAAKWTENHHWQVIVKGPISLAKAYNDHPMNLPGPN
jgi:hypothetical protein